MVTLYDALLDAAQGGICDLADLSGRLAPPQPLRRFDLLEPFRQQFRNFLAAKFCNKPPLPPSEQFFGGQCEGDTYRINFNRVRRFWSDSPDFIEPGEAVATGPIISLRTAIVSSGDGADVYDLVIESGDGIIPAGAAIVVSRIPGGPTNVREVLFTDFTLTNLTRPSDDCGNPGPLTPDYDPRDFTFNNTIFYTNNEGNEFAVNAAFVVGVAYLDANLNVNVPVNITLNPSINPSINPKFDLGITFNISTGGARFDLPRDPTLPTPRPPLPPDSRPDGYDSPTAPPQPPEVPEPPDIPPQDRTRRVIKAALVTVIAQQEGGKVGTLTQDENPDIAIPNFGFISFLCRASNSSSGWTPDIPVKNARCFIPCPWEGGAWDVAGTPQPGIEFIVTPVFGEVTVPV